MVNRSECSVCDETYYYVKKHLNVRCGINLCHVCYHLKLTKYGVTK